MNFTPSQKQAVDLRDCSLIVSAGAGSGKTAVLTERILERICDVNDDVYIDDFLIVTFTNAAAKELADRIRNKLTERAELGYNPKITKNIARLPLAKISTINSFCYELVRENFQNIGLSASLRIADETEMSVIREKLMNEVLDEYFETRGDDKDFLSAYEIFASSKNDKNFVSVLLELDTKLRNLTDPENFKKELLNEYVSLADGCEFFSTSFGKELYNNTKALCENCILVMEDLAKKCAPYIKLCDAYLPAIEYERDFARRIFHSLDNGYESVRETVGSYVKSSLKAVRNFEDPCLKDVIKDSKNSVAGSFVNFLFDNFSCTKDELSLAAADTHSVIKVLFNLVDTFSIKLSEKKSSLSIIEFSDCERYALSLLVESIDPFVRTDLAKTLEKRYREIYIDEYQDVNPLQDLIFKALCRNSEDGECSRFMVGDIKQSIYRFRGARSEIFMNYRDSFKDPEENGSRKRIFMSSNFRSSRNVIALTNIVFSTLMKSYFTEGDFLTFGRHEENPVTAPTELCVFNYDKEKGYSSDELEAFLIADKIKKLVGNPDILGPDGKMYSYSDVGILARSKSALKSCEKILESVGIPTRSDVGESFFGKKETLLCLNILNAIDNPTRDIYLAGFMRSPLSTFSDDELAIIKQKYKNRTLYHAVTKYASDEDTRESSLGKKCGEFCSLLTKLRNYSRGKSAEKLVWKVYCELDVFSVCCSDSFTKDKIGTRRNLLKLYQMARDFSSTSFHGLGAFIDYINSSQKNSDVKAERDMGKSAVNLMTIHASKGLEFPVCFVCSLSKKFNKSDETSKLVFSEKTGIASTLCDTPGTRSAQTGTGLISINTPFRTIIADEIDRDTIEEEIRILYVALTRARDRLVLTGAFPKKMENSLSDALVMKNTNSFDTAGNYMALILSVLSDSNAISSFYSKCSMDYKTGDMRFDDILTASLYETDELVKMYACLIDKPNDTHSSNLQKDNAPEGLVNALEALSSMIPERKPSPAKLTVSQLKIGLIDMEKIVSADKEKRAISLPTFMQKEVLPTAADKGTAMHMFMQFADYSLCEKDCRAEAERLCNLGFITETQKKLLDVDKLSQFFDSDFYGRIKKSKKIYREQRFNISASILDDKAEKDILVQGVIDLFFLNDDGTYTLVDFKTDRVFSDDAENILIDRHKDQLMYYKQAVAEMTESDVRDVYIYSFSLMKEIEVE